MNELIKKPGEVMRKDINIPEVKNISIAIAKDQESWSIYLINNHHKPLDDAMVVSKGHGVHHGEEVKTSTLRHYLGTVEANNYAPIERIDPGIFHLNHEFWVTFYIEGRIFDKKFIFEAGSLSEEKLSYIKELEKDGIINS